MTGAAWLSERLLLLLGRLPRVEPGDLRAAVASPEQAVEAEGRCLSYRSRGRLARKRKGKLVALRLPAGGLPPNWSHLELRSGTRTVSVEAEALEDVLTELEALLDQELSLLDPGTREEMWQFVLSAAAVDLEHSGGFSLRRNLHVVRDALREPLPTRAIERDEPQAVHVDELVAIDDTAFWITGWTRDEDGTFNRLSVVSPEGQEASLDDYFRIRRPDVEKAYGGSGRPGWKHGFAKFFELASPSPLERGWIVELRDSDGAGIQADVPPVVHDFKAVRDLLLAEFAEERPDNEELRVKHLGPALARFQERHRKSVEIEDVVEYGVGPDSPTVSVVVTLYRRIDFLQHHLLHFAQDPAMGDAELIYVLDSPELAGPLSKLASSMHAFHGIPFRIVRLTRNGGFSIANNLGASLARGRLLLLLNSDVLPARPGWLRELASFYDTTPDIGALGPKLLFEDDSIQHAGMYFERDADPRFWGVLHYFKGLARNFAPACVNRPVPAVTAACVMIDRALYEELGGLSSAYVQIGFEDSDLCLQLVARGLRNWYLGEVELYHLEGQAHPAPSGIDLTTYNAWLHTHRWDSLIEQVMDEEALRGAAAPTGDQA